MALDKAILEEAIQSGDVIKLTGEVEVSARASPTGRKEVRPYVKYAAQTVKGMVVLCGGKLAPDPDEKGACYYFNTGYDMEARQKARRVLLSELEDPLKKEQRWNRKMRSIMSPRVIG